MCERECVCEGKERKKEKKKERKEERKKKEERKERRKERNWTKWGAARNKTETEKEQTNI